VARHLPAAVGIFSPTDFFIFLNQDFCKYAPVVVVVGDANNSRKFPSQQQIATLVVSLK